MRSIPDSSVDAIICDLPYGFTDCKWDTIIPFADLWPEYRRIIKPKGSCVLFGNQPFTTAMIGSNRREYSHMWYWKKDAASGHLNARRQPLRIVEDIAVFILNRKPGTRATYNPQGLKDCDIIHIEKVHLLYIIGLNQRFTGRRKPDTRKTCWNTQGPARRNASTRRRSRSRCLSTL